MPRAVLIVAHPTVDAAMAFPDGRDWPDVAGAMQGVSILNLARRGAEWIVIDGGFQNRRLTARTLCRLGAEGGPAVGIIGVTGGCATPWGSVLLAEGGAAAWAGRLPGIDPAADGMLAELDPADPSSVPVKPPPRAASARWTPPPASPPMAAPWSGWWMAGPAASSTASCRMRRPGPAPSMPGASPRRASKWLAALAAAAGGRPARRRAPGRRHAARPAPRRRLRRASRSGSASPRAAGRGRSSTSAPQPATWPPRPASPRSSSMAEKRRSQPTRRGEAAAAVPAWPWAPASLGFDRDGALLIGTDRAATGPAPCPRPSTACRCAAPTAASRALLLATPVGAAAAGAAVAADGTIIAAVAHPGGRARRNLGGAGDALARPAGR